MLDIDVAGIASSSRTRAGSRSRRAPEGDHVRAAGRDQRLGTLVGADDKFAAHNAASWKHGLLVRVPKGVVLEQPLYVRVANSRQRGSLFWRLLVDRRKGGRFSADRGVRLRAARPRRLLERRRRALRRAGAKLEYVSLQNLSRDTWHFATHHARVEPRRRARLGHRRLRLEEGEDADPERPRRPGRDLARDRRVLRRRRAAPRLRHLPGAHRAEHDLGLRVQGRVAR